MGTRYVGILRAGLFAGLISLMAGCGKSEQELAQSKAYLDEIKAAALAWVEVATSDFTYPETESLEVVRSCTLLARLSRTAHDRACVENPIVVKLTAADDWGPDLVSAVREYKDAREVGPSGTVSSGLVEQVVGIVEPELRAHSRQAFLDAEATWQRGVMKAEHQLDRLAQRLNAGSGNRISLYDLDMLAFGGKQLLADEAAFTRWRDRVSAITAYDSNLSSTDLSNSILRRALDAASSLSSEARSEIATELSNESWAKAEPDDQQMAGIDEAKLALFAQSSQPSQTSSVSMASADFKEGTRLFIDVSVDWRNFSDLTVLDREAQVLDWLLMAVVDELGFDAKDAERVLFDEPLDRSWILRDFSTLQAGQLRNVVLDEQLSIALTPTEATKEETNDLLADAVDLHRMRTGQKPAKLIHVAYSIHPSFDGAWIERQADIDASRFFQRTGGYIESSIEKIDDLTAFLGEIEDLVYVSARGRKLVLGGRQVGHRDPLGLQIEDIATLWLAGPSRFHHFNAAWKKKSETLEASFQAQAKRFNDNAKKRNDNLYETAISRNWTESNYASAALKLRSSIEIEWTELEQRIEREARAFESEQEAAYLEALPDLITDVGFSLDPEVDYEGLHTFLTEEFKQTLADSRAALGVSIFDIGDFDSAVAALVKTTPSLQPLLVFLDEQIPLANAPLGPEQTSENFVARLAAQLTLQGLQDAIIKKFRYQAARYDGRLKGTKVGMTLFYTDLLAKLWILDLEGSAPRDIEDFPALGTIEMAGIHKTQIKKLPGTRVWFGPKDDSYSLVEDGQGNLSFARNVVRIYAASSDTLRQGDETSPNTWSKLLLHWWDNQYERVSHYERQYGRLNQILKWTVTINWLIANKHGDLLTFLDDYRDIERDLWFPEWSKDHATNLTFQDWSSIPFLPRNRKTETEALPILISAPFTMFRDLPEQSVVSGGVSGARIVDLAEKAPISRRIDASIRRGSLDYSRSSSSSLVFKNGRGVKFGGNSNRATTFKSVPEQTRLLSTWARVQSLELEQTTYDLTEGIRVRTQRDRASGADIISTKYERFPGNTRGIEVSAGARRIAVKIGRGLSQDVAWSKRLLEDPRVEMVLRQRDTGYYLVALPDGKWVQYRYIEKRAIDPDPGWIWVERPSAYTVGVACRFLDPAMLKSVLSGYDRLLLDANPQWARFGDLLRPSDQAPKALRASFGSGGKEPPEPPTRTGLGGEPSDPGRRPVVVQIATDRRGQDLVEDPAERGFIGELVVKIDELPEHMENLGRVLSSVDFNVLRKRIDSAGDLPTESRLVKIELPDSQIKDTGPLKVALEKRDVASVRKALEGDRGIEPLEHVQRNLDRQAQTAMEVAVRGEGAYFRLDQIPVDRTSQQRLLRAVDGFVMELAGLAGGRGDDDSGSGIPPYELPKDFDPDRWFSSLDERFLASDDQNERRFLLIAGAYVAWRFHEPFDTDGKLALVHHPAGSGDMELHLRYILADMPKDMAAKGLEQSTSPIYAEQKLIEKADSRSELLRTTRPQKVTLKYAPLNPARLEGQHFSLQLHDGADSIKEMTMPSQVYEAGPNRSAEFIVISIWRETMRERKGARDNG